VIDPNGNIFQIDIATGCTTALLYQCPGRNITDIAIDGAGRLYICNQDSLFTLNTNNPGLGCVYLGKFSFTISGLIVWQDGNIYASGNGLSKYNPQTQTFSYLGDFPVNVISAGDLIEYKNRMYMSAVDGNIYEINISNPALSTLFYRLDVTSIYGMLTVAVKCFNETIGQSRVIAFEQTGYTSRAYLIDMENKISFPDYCLPQVPVMGCASQNTATITGNKIQVSDIHTTAPFCYQLTDGSIKITMIPSAVNVYLFSADNQPDINSGVFTNLAAGVHMIRIKSQFGCYIDTAIIIPAANFECKDSVFIPSAFTPNQDGLNDLFRTKSYLPVTNFKMKIFNREGQNIYTSSSVIGGWDGKFRFVPQPSGVYVWLISYTSFSGRNIFRKGTVTLIR
jgi:gliding motility-associated-like protein